MLFINYLFYPFFIERAVYYMECCLHPLFNISQGTNRLDYRRVENRYSFLFLLQIHFKEIVFMVLFTLFCLSVFL